MESVQLEEILSAVEKRDVESLKNMAGKKIDIPLIYKLDLRSINTIFRTKSENDIVRFKCDITDPRTFSYIPHGCAKLGRMNYPGQSIFYGSLAPKTNLLEIVKDDLQIGQKFCVSKWAVKKKKEINALTIIRPENIQEGLKEEKDFFINNSKVIEKYGKELRALAKLMLKNDSVEEEINHWASAIVANGFYDNVSAIWYPSVKNKEGEFVNANVAILPKVVDEEMKLVSVVKGKLLYDKESLDIEEIGFNEKGIIRWYKVTVNYNKIDWNVSCVIDECGKKYPLEKCKYEDEHGVSISRNEIKKSIRNYHKNLVDSKVFIEIHSAVFDKFCSFSHRNEINKSIEILRVQNVEKRFVRKRGKATKVKKIQMSGLVPITISVKEEV